MTKKPLIIFPLILIVHSAATGIYRLYSRPPRFVSSGLDALWVQFFALFAAMYFAKKVRAKYWAISIIAVALVGFPRVLTDAFPAHAHLLLAAELALDAISAAALFAAARYDTFDLSLWEKRHVSASSYIVKIVVGLLIILGIFLYFGRG